MRTLGISLKILCLLFTGLFLSCTFEEPTIGENSFFARVNGQKYIAQTSFSFPSPAQFGIQAYKNDSIWHISIDDQSGKYIEIYLNNIEYPGTYKVQNVIQEFPHQLPREMPTSVILRESYSTFYLPKEEAGPEYIQITHLQDSLIIGQFLKITLENPDNSGKSIVLKNGMFHFNLTTLNKGSSDTH